MNTNTNTNTTTTKVTKKDMFLRIKEILAEDEAIVTFCDAEIERLDNQSAAAKKRAEKKKAEGDELKAAVLECVGTEYEPIADITERVSEKIAEATVAKVTARLNALFKENLVVKNTIEVVSDSGKRKVMGYALVPDEVEAED